MATCLYFDNVKFDIFDLAVLCTFLSCTAHWKISTCPLTPRCKTDFYSMCCSALNWFLTIPLLLYWHWTSLWHHSLGVI